MQGAALKGRDTFEYYKQASQVQQQMKEFQQQTFGKSGFRLSK